MDYNLLSTSSLSGTDVTNRKGENLGDLKDIMLDLESGEVAYAVISFGGFLGIGDKLFAVPWEALTFDKSNEQIIMDVSKEKLEMLQVLIRITGQQVLTGNLFRMYIHIMDISHIGKEEAVLLLLIPIKDHQLLVLEPDLPELQLDMETQDWVIQGIDCLRMKVELAEAG
jgi:sporulation protein YlmC with PRC-barrel domain